MTDTALESALLAKGGLPLGVNITLSNDPKQVEADCALAASFKAKWVRTSQEFTWDNEQWMKRLQVFRAACDHHGLLLWQTCQGVPARFSDTGKAGHYVTTTQAGQDWFGESVAEAASVADATGMGNENNGFGSQDVHPMPEALADMCASVIEQRDKLSPDRQLCTPELCPAGGENMGQDHGKWDTYIEPLLFFKAMVKHNPKMIRGRKLWIGWHGYTDNRFPADDPQLWNQWWRIRELHSTLVSLKVPNKSICSPEFGCATGPSNWYQVVTPARQAVAFDEYIAEWKSQLAVGVKRGPAIWYALRDHTPNPNIVDWPAYCGLVDIHGNKKPVADRFMAAAA